MAEPATGISKRAVFRAPEVCEIAGLQAFVLRSWEAEFPDLGVARSPGGPRLYSRTDVERVLQLKHLVFGEGLTLGGARRRIDEERGRGGPAPDEGSLPLDELLGAEARERLSRVRDGLRAILDLLSPSVGATPAPVDFALTQPAVPSEAPRKRSRSAEPRPAGQSPQRSATAGR